MKSIVVIFITILLSILTVVCSTSPQTENDFSFSGMEKITEVPDISTNESRAPLTSEEPVSSDSQSVTEETKGREVFSEIQV